MRRLIGIPVLSALTAAALAIPSLASASPADPSGAGKEPVATGTGGGVASMDLNASRAGIDVLKHGGNAIDAAVATASTLGVTIPFVAGPGGGGFMVIYLARTHQVVTINGRETCPAACTTSMFIDPKTGQPLGYDYASDQPLATGVPSMVATWAQALKRYGRQQPERRPAAGHSGGPPRVPGQRRFPAAHPVRAARAAGLPGQPQAAADQGRKAAARRLPADQPGPGPHLPAAGPPRPVLPVRRTAGQGHRPGR